ncbi:MAG: 30S ribosomal protein S6 [Bdellovibrionaceae bacterium]|nr:30S ribosomal protein S6 [Pseudobdellovibrionaceae bacterium]|tara:strand:+ start:474 stop:887 length:414 start_codon:yes stop_codon:yes gene_type:complete
MAIQSGYETTLITQSSLTEDQYSKITSKVEEVIKKFNGEMVISQDLGKRRLAYEINKEGKGHYTYFAYSGDHGVVSELERQFRISEHVMRFLTVKLSDEFDKETFLKESAEKEVRKKAQKEERGRERDRDRDRDYRR